MGEECSRGKTIAMNNTIRVNFIVEGPTEEIFVRGVLKEPLALRGIYINARSVAVSRKPIKGAKYVKAGKQFTIRRGGLLDFDKAREDINLWVSEDKDAYLTTMFDLYALPENFPAYDDAKRQNDPFKKVRVLEEAFEAGIDNDHFIPYIQLHEFEGLLFSDIRAMDEVLSPYHGGSKLSKLTDIRNSFNSPEEINDGEETAPSKRLLSIYDSYEKPTDGLRIARRIGLDVLRRECQHFNKWMIRLEELAIYKRR
jgi:hypothetical protein